GIAGGLVIMVAGTRLLQTNNAKMFATAAGIAVLAGAMIIMAKAVEAFAGIEWADLGKGMAGIAGVLAITAIFGRLASGAGKMMGAAAGLLILAGALKLMASAVRDFAGFDWADMGKGLAG